MTTHDRAAVMFCSNKSYQHTVVVWSLPSGCDIIRTRQRNRKLLLDELRPEEEFYALLLMDEKLTQRANSAS